MPSPNSSNSNALLGLLALAIVGGLFLLLGGGFAAYFLLARGESHTHQKNPASDGPSASVPAGGQAKAEPAPAVGLFGPSAGKEGETWTLHELTRYLQSKGAIPGDGKVSYETHLQGVKAFVRIGDERRIVIGLSQMPTAKAAKEHLVAGDEEAQFSWGRFMIFGGKEYVARVQNLLTR